MWHCIQVTDTETVGTLKVNEVEEETYWEPSNDANELYQQLSSKRYREIKSSQIEYETRYYSLMHSSNVRLIAG